MKICFIGLGSIGKRHLINLRSALDERGVSAQIDAVRRLNRPLPDDVSALLSNVYSAQDEAPGDYDIAFITNPTSLHYETVENMISKTRHMFIEKPVFSDINNDWQSLAWRSGGVYYVACPLRYAKVTKYLKEYAQKSKVYAARCICSSYLPDWRPGADYRQCYSASAEQGGGVRLDLIHEWDYLKYLFDAPTDVCEYHGKRSHLEITSEDIAVYMAQYHDKTISLHLDYFGRFTRREIELYTEEDVIIGDITNQCIRFLRAGNTVSLKQERDEMQKDEIRCFLDMTEGKRQNHNTVADAVDTLKIALGYGESN